MHKDTKAKGFTLIEILAATGIMTIIILIVLSLTTNVLTVWNRSTGQLTANYEARVALDIMATDLETMVLRNRDFCWLDVIYDEPSTSTQIESFDGALPEMPEIYFMARVEDRPRETSGGLPIYGDICTVGYALKYQDPVTGGTASSSSTFPMFGLYRLLIDSEHTFEDVMGSDQALLRDAIMDSGYYDQHGNVGTVNINTISRMENFLAANIVDFSLVFWYTDENGELRSITSGGDGTGDGQNFQYTNKLNIVDDPTVTGTLEFVDITVTVMSNEGMQLIQNNDASVLKGSDGDTDLWFKLVDEYGQTFSRRIQIMAKPL
ncbi:PulJ/GspJ family protein [Cerasicoccus maritimus]|uniref:PulJ/GspJ family protein n=1 Tax=Cerasicoccus maritimus TaxID=490089 RepID=UPI002852985C|nr:prepilin-type N-terminal cleavage/methylation domain-containing protein [Cerasicoccus maritimus]